MLGQLVMLGMNERCECSFQLMPCYFTAPYAYLT